MSATPETDKQAVGAIGFYSCATVPAELARRLEHERNEARKTLRDYFAAHALPAFIALDQKWMEVEDRLDCEKEDHSKCDHSRPACWEEWDRWSGVTNAAYACAESMMIQREAWLDPKKWGEPQ